MGDAVHLTWSFSRSTTDALQEFIAANSSRRLVRDRKRLNVQRIGIDISAAKTWRVLMGCFATTQQRSGEGTAVSRFLESDSEVLDVKYCLRTTELAATAKRSLKVAGLRRNDIIARQAEEAIQHFSGAKWKHLSDQLNSILVYPTLRKERETATYLRTNFLGLGPKQSRNLIQWIGLSRYVVPLDSRFSKHLLQFGFPVPLSSQTLQDEDFYRFVEDGIQEVAAAVDVYPCIYDACVFASFENEA